MHSTSSSIRYSSIGASLEEPIINQLMAIPLENPDILSLAAGFTDNIALPAKIVQDVVSRMPQNNPNNEYLQYGTTQGRPRLRRLTCDHLNGYAVESDQVFQPDLTFITNGSQQALFLATQTLCDPGDYVLVESPSYFVYLSMLQGMQVNPIGIPVDSQGKIDRAAFAELVKQLKREGKAERIKAAYLIGYHANPSSRCLSLEEKQIFAEVMHAHDLIVPVIEDAAYRDLSYAEFNPTPSVMSLKEFSEFPKLYLGTYTKPFATGLKIGYGCCSDEEWFQKMVCSKGNQDFGTSNFSQAIIERVLLEDKYTPLVEYLGDHYGKKADRLNQVMESSGIREKGWRWTKPEGGLLFWVKAPDAINTSMGGEFCEACKAQGVIYVPGNFCFASGEPHCFIRLSIGALSDEKLVEAANRFCQVANQF